jgi:hypothetical protein
LESELNARNAELEVRTTEVERLKVCSSSCFICFIWFIFSSQNKGQADSDRNGFGSESRESVYIGRTARRSDQRIVSARFGAQNVQIFCGSPSEGIGNQKSVVWRANLAVDFKG